MPSHSTLDHVRPIALDMLDMAARDAWAQELAAPMLRLGGGTREGQGDANLLLATAFAEILDADARPSAALPKASSTRAQCDHDVLESEVT